MTLFKCPGSERIREPFPENIKCFCCGAEAEIWSDEVETKCPSCGSKVARTPPASCLEWCACARECVGPEKFTRFKKAARERGRAIAKKICPGKREASKKKGDE